jgi:hypothetical protein
MTPPANFPYPLTQFVSPKEWWVNDGRSLNPDPSVCWQDFAVFGSYYRTSSTVTTDIFSLSYLDPTGSIVHIQDPVQQKVAITERTTASMVGWLPPVTNGKRSKLYQYFYNIFS